jgi:hypothetical protein
MELAIIYSSIALLPAARALADVCLHISHRSASFTLLTLKLALLYPCLFLPSFRGSSITNERNLLFSTLRIDLFDEALEVNASAKAHASLQDLLFSLDSYHLDLHYLLLGIESFSLLAKLLFKPE